MDEEKIKNFKWSDQSEKEFLNHRLRLKSDFGKSKFNKKQLSDVSLGNFSREMCKKKNMSEFREQIMKKYMNRELMTKEELNYLDMTSNLTHKFIDKTFYKKMVQVIDKKTIAQLEIDLVNQILDNYLKIKQYIECRRDDYLKKQLQRHHSRVKGTDIKIMDEKLAQIQQNLDFKKWLKKNIAQASRAENNLIR